MKKIFAITAIIALLVCLSGCNMTIIDTTFKFDTAIISLPDGTIVKGKVETWTDFENSDQLQVKIDGKIYLVHSEDVALIKE